MPCVSMIPRRPSSTLFPYTTLFRSDLNRDGWLDLIVIDFPGRETWWFENPKNSEKPWPVHPCTPVTNNESPQYADIDGDGKRDRKSTRLNSSHGYISYAVFCLKKKN